MIPLQYYFGICDIMDTGERVCCAVETGQNHDRTKNGAMIQTHFEELSVSL